MYIRQLAAGLVAAVVFVIAHMQRVVLGRSKSLGDGGGEVEDEKIGGRCVGWRSSGGVVHLYADREGGRQKDVKWLVVVVVCGGGGTTYVVRLM